MKHSGATGQKRRYLTKAGFEWLQAQMRDLLFTVRPKATEDVAAAAALGDRSENYEYKLGKKKLREIDGRLHRLKKILESSEVIDPATRPKTDRVFFGATVTVEDEEGEEATYQIVGTEELEAPLGPGRISYESPLGRALLGKREGDEITVRRPAGLSRLTIVSVEWK